MALSSRAVWYSSIGLGVLLAGGQGVGQEDVDGRVVDVDVQAFVGPFLGRGGVSLGQVPLGQGLANVDVVGVVRRDHRQVVQELRRLLLPQVNPRQPRDPLGVERVVLAGQLVELLGLVELAGLHLQLGQEVDHPLVGLLRVERRLEDRAARRRRRRSSPGAGP